MALYGLAGTLAYQRVQSDKHWASDVWLGAAAGWGVVKIVIRRHEPDGGVSRVSMIPSIDPVTGGVGVRVTKTS